MCIPSFKSHPSLSGLKKVCVRSFPSSSGILKGSFLMLSYKFYTNDAALQLIKALKGARVDKRVQQTSQGLQTDLVSRPPHPKKLLGQISSVVDASVHGREALNRRFVLHVWVVQARVQHDHGEGQHITGVWKARATCVRVCGCV